VNLKELVIFKENLTILCKIKMELMFVIFNLFIKNVCLIKVIVAMYGPSSYIILVISSEDGKGNSSQPMKSGVIGKHSLDFAKNLYIFVSVSCEVKSYSWNILVGLR
jgi:hypothetical protein